jgi:hypothetical protein
MQHLQESPLLAGRIEAEAGGLEAGAGRAKRSQFSGFLV